MGFCGWRNLNRPGFVQRIDGDDLAAVVHGFLQIGQHARVIRAGVMTDDEHRVGLGEVTDFDRRLSDADGGAQAGAGRFMAHVGAVGQVVRAELADEQLIAEGCFVAGAAAGVEHRLVRTGEAVELVGDHLERVGPVDRLVMLAAAAQHHRLRDAALIAEPHFRLLGEFGDRVLFEKLGRHLLARRFPGDGLRPAFTKLGGVAGAVGIGVGTAGTVEAALLIHDQKCVSAANRRFLGSKPHRLIDGRIARGDFRLVAGFPG